MLGVDPRSYIRQSNDDNDNHLRPFVGLRNLGNTCFLNVVIQVLYHNVMMRDAIFNIGDVPDDKDFYESIKQLQLTFGHMSIGKKSVYNVIDFANLLRLNVDEQQDPQEFTKLYLTRIASLTTNMIDNRRLTIGQLLDGKECHFTQCMNCHKAGKRNSTFHELDLPIEGCATLDDAISSYFQREKLEGDNMYYCDSCDIKVNAERWSEIISWPPVLCLQLLRYVYDKTTWQKRKVKTEITFPNELKLPNSKEVYHLVAIIYHVGNSAHNGHYVNEVLDWETGEWFFCDDDVVVSSPQTSTSKSKESSQSNKDSASADISENDEDREESQTPPPKKVKKLIKKKASPPPEPATTSAQPKTKTELASQKKLNRPKEVYSLTYISDTLLKQSKQVARSTPSNELVQIINSNNITDQRKVTQYETSRQILENTISTRKELYNSIKDILAPKPGGSYRLIPALWLTQWIRGEKIITKIKDNKETEKASSNSSSSSSSSNKEVITIDDDDERKNGDIRMEIDLTSPIKVNDNTTSNDSIIKMPEIFCEPINTITLKCKHGAGLPPAEILKFKVISCEAYDKIVESIAVDFGWDNTNVICDTCDGNNIYHI